MRKVALVVAILVLAGCADETPMIWRDVTGRGRGQPEMTMDSGQCQLVAQQAAMAQQSLVNQQNATGCGGSNAGCAALGLMQGLSISNARQTAFNACLNSAGWVQQPATP